MNQVTVLGFGRIHLDHYRGRCPFHAHGREETAEQFVKNGFSPWIVRDKVLHNAFLLNSHVRAGPKLLLTFWALPKIRNGPVEGSGHCQEKKQVASPRLLRLELFFPSKQTKTPASFRPLQSRRSCGKWSWKPRRYQPENFRQPDSPGSQSLPRMARGRRHRRFLCRPTN
jgi:hypothetical protein